MGHYMNSRPCVVQNENFVCSAAWPNTHHNMAVIALQLFHEPWPICDFGFLVHEIEKMFRSPG